MPQELRKLSKRSVIVVKQGIEPALCVKAFYYLDRVFLDRLASVSKSLKSLLASGKTPTQEQLTELRAAGEFAASLATAPFKPFTHHKPDEAGPGATKPHNADQVEEVALPTFSLAEAAYILNDRIPEFSATATTEDWIEIVIREAAAVFSHTEEGAKS
jgi:type IV secretion system protein VirD4